jgi:hypothetical protein
VESWQELVAGEAGDYMVTRRSDGTKGIIMNCPRCGSYASSSEGHVILTENPLTMEPSFVCPHEGCGAHYFVKNGQIIWA